MKKLLLATIFVSFQFAGLAQIHTPDLRKIVPFQEPIPDNVIRMHPPVTGVNDAIQQSDRLTSKNGTTSLLNTLTTIGGTTYDLQTNGSLGSRLYFLNDTIGGVWNHSQVLNLPFSDRRTGYNFNDGTNWIGPPAISDSLIFATIDIGSNNTEYLVGHNAVSLAAGDLILLKRSPAGVGVWQKSILPPHPQGNYCLWAKMAVGGTNGSTIHVVALTQPTALGGSLVNGMDGVMTYSRSQDGGITWDKVHELLPGIDQTFYKSMLAESYAIDVRGNTVAIVQGSLYNDWVLWKSNDNGTTWNKNVAWTYPIQAYDPTNSITDINGDGVADTIEFIDSSIEVLIDNNDLVHSWAGRMRSIQEIVGQGLGYFPETDGLYYWNENFQSINPLILTSAVDIDTNGVITIEPSIAKYERSLTSMPSAGVDASNNIYLCYSSIKENTSSGNVPSQSFRNTYCMVSPDGGNSWSLPVNVFDSDFDEIVYPSLARNVGPDLHLTVQVDGEPGISFYNGNPIGSNDINYLSKNVNTTFAGVPVSPIFNRGLSGNVYYDQNLNGVKDAGDFGLNNFNISISPNGNTAVTNSQGDYFYNTLSGNYVVSNTIPANWQLTSDSANYSVNLVTGVVDSLDFGLFPTASTYMVEPLLISGIPRCNFEINYWINYFNSGTAMNAGIVRFIKDPQLSFVSSFPPYNSASADTFEWNYSGLYAFEQRTIRITTNSLGLFPGDTVLNQAEVVFNTSSLPMTNSSSLVQAIDCSFDPNDKIVIPEGIDAAHYTLKTDTLVYTIRFQNTGNDTAFVVKIRDTLSSYLDYSTFKFVGSSHSVNIARQLNGALLFTFNNILLPDSTTNFAESNGFITYSIRALPGINSGAVIENTAHIFFDYNPAIVTNTTFNTMMDAVGISNVGAIELQLIAMPNPFSNDVIIKFSKTLTESNSLQISDITGRVVLVINNVKGQQVQLPLENITPGIYFCDLISKTGMVKDRLKLIKK